MSTHMAAAFPCTGHAPISNGMHTAQWHHPATWLARLAQLAACLALLSGCTSQIARPTTPERPPISPVPTFTPTPPMAPEPVEDPATDQQPATPKPELPGPEPSQPDGTAETPPPGPIGTGVVVNAAVLNVRSGPDVNSGRLGQLATNTVVQVLEGTADRQWWHVCCLPDGVTSGWVYSQYLDVHPPPSTVDGTAREIATTTTAPKPPAPATSEAEAHAALSQMLPWYGNPPYPLAVVPILEIWLRDLEFGRDLAQALWITDGIDRLEDDAIYGLGRLYDHDPALARRLLAHASEEPVQSRNTMFLGSLNEMILHGHQGKFESLIAQPWFADGLDAEERAFIVAIQKITGLDAMFERLLTSPRITQSKTIALPLAGEVNLWVFHNDSSRLDEAILTAIERGARGVERLMGAPFPLTDLIVLYLNVENCDVDPCGGANFVDSMVLVDSGGRLIGERTLYHELAHFYLTAEFGPFWLYEGGATFVTEYVVAQTRQDGALWEDEHALPTCQEHGVPNLHELNNFNHPNPVWQETCGYVLGSYFLTKLFNTMGEAAFSSAMRELYGMYLDYQYYATDEQVYRMFLKHTPPDREAAFQEWYRRLHGGPFLDGH